MTSHLLLLLLLWCVSVVQAFEIPVPSATAVLVRGGSSGAEEEAALLDDRYDLQEDDYDDEGEGEWAEDNEEEDEEEMEEVIDFLEETLVVDEEQEILDSLMEEEEEEEDEIEQEEDDDDELPVYHEEEIDEEVGFSSSAFVDRMELADAYDEGETTAAEGPAVTLVAATVSHEPAARGGHEEEDGSDGEADETAASGDQDETTGISAEMQGVLVRDLKFKKEDIAVLRPDIAEMLISEGLCKPVEGMPPNWYLPGTYKPPNNRKLVPIAATAVATVASVALAIRLQSTDSDVLSEAWGKLSGLLATIPAAVQAALPSKKESVSKPIAAAAEVVTEAASEVVPDEEENEQEPPKNEYVHSIQPGETNPPAEDPDETMLDKFLTKIENGIKAFFRIKI